MVERASTAVKKGKYLQAPYSISLLTLDVDTTKPSAPILVYSREHAASATKRVIPQPIAPRKLLRCARTASRRVSFEDLHKT